MSKPEALKSPQNEESPLQGGHVPEPSAYSAPNAAADPTLSSIWPAAGMCGRPRAEAILFNHIARPPWQGPAGLATQWAPVPSLPKCYALPTSCTACLARASRAFLSLLSPILSCPIVTEPQLWNLCISSQQRCIMVCVVALLSLSQWYVKLWFVWQFMHCEWVQKNQVGQKEEAQHYSITHRRNFYRQQKYSSGKKISKNIRRWRKTMSVRWLQTCPSGMAKGNLLNRKKIIRFETSKRKEDYQTG